MVHLAKQTKTQKSKIKIIIVDDHPIVRQGLKKFIDNEKGLFVCGTAENAPLAIEAIQKQKPDMMIVDISLKDISGIELIRDIRIRYPGLPVLALSMHDESLYAERALRAGARGYIMKDEAVERIITAIHMILEGEIYESEKISARMVRKLVGGGPNLGASPIDCLSDRELEVFLLIGKGYGTRKISEQLNLSVKTIETYRAHIKEKLNLVDATELLQYAIQYAGSGGGA